MPSHQIKTTITHEALAKFIQGLRARQLELPTTASGIIRRAVDTASWYLTQGDPSPPGPLDYQVLSTIIDKSSTGRSISQTFGRLGQSLGRPTGMSNPTGVSHCEPALEMSAQAQLLNLPNSCLDHITDPEMRKKAGNQLGHWRSGAICPSLSLENPDVQEVAQALCAALEQEGVNMDRYKKLDEPLIDLDTIMPRQAE